MKHEQLTAWALNELSPEEKAQLEAALHDDAAAQQQAREAREFCDFLSTTLFDPHIALAEEQRSALQQAAAAVSTPTNTAPPAQRPWWRRSTVRVLAAAAVISLLATNAWLLLRDPARNQPLLAGNTPPLASPTTLDSALIELPSINDPRPTIQADYDDMRRLKPIDLVAQNSLLPTVDPSPFGLETTSGDPQYHFRGQGLAQAPPPPLTPGQPLLETEELFYSETNLTLAASGLESKAKTELTKIGSGTIVLSGANTSTGAAAINGGLLGPDSAATSNLATMPVDAYAAVPAPSLPVTVLTRDNSVEGLSAAAATPAPTVAAVTVNATKRNLDEADGAAPAAPGATALPYGNAVPALGALTKAPAQPAPASPFTPGKAAPAATAAPAAGAKAADAYLAEAGNHQRSRALNRYKPETTTLALGDIIPPATTFPEPTPHPRPEMGRELPKLLEAEPHPHRNTESYTQIVENTLQDVARAPLSTFSIDVDTAAYANVRRFLNQNTRPPPDAIRIEELINYFPTNAEGPDAQAKEPFAVGIEMAECPWQPQHRLARISIKGRELGNERKPSNLVFLVDVSGSMNQPNKLPLVQQSLRMLTEKLGEEDTVSMVVYAGSSGLVLPPTNGMNKSEILAAIDRLQAGGSTHGSAGLRLAYDQAVSGFIKGGVNRVILCTDGDFNVGISTPEELEKLITEKARSGVFLSVLGYGAGNLKDRTMETLADKGNGNYAYIDSLSEARKVLVQQMGGTLVTIAKDVKIQVEFNPRVIRGYRLIGYENRLLAKEDFNDDTKDAGEIGAGHTVTALYELVPANLPPGAEPRGVVDDLKYQPRPAAPAAAAAPPAEAVPLDDARAKEALTVKLRYKEPEGATSRLIEVPVNDDARRIDAASSEFKFTAAVAGFGLLLRHSSYAGSLTWETVRDLAQQGKGTDTHGYRGEFLQLIEKARGVSNR